MSKQKFVCRHGLINKLYIHCDENAVAINLEYVITIWCTLKKLCVYLYPLGSRRRVIFPEFLDCIWGRCADILSISSSSGCGASFKQETVPWVNKSTLNLVQVPVLPLLKTIWKEIDCYLRSKFKAIIAYYMIKLMLNHWWTN